MRANNQPINLFWTGGMDSTFRLIQLTVVYNKVVQPYYIIDPNRNSILFEIPGNGIHFKHFIFKIPGNKNVDPSNNF